MKHSWISRIIFVLFFLVFFGVYETSFASSSLYFSNPPKILEEGDRVSIDVKVNSTDQSINAISGVLSFPSDLLHVVSISKDKSIINLWTKEPKVYRDRIVFEGIILNPGFQGTDGEVMQITFEAKQAGVVNLSFSEGSVLANDGLGSNVLVAFSETNFKIITKPPVLPPKTIVVQIGKKVEETTPILIPKKLVALPVITEYSESALTSESIFLKGQGEPNAQTKIVFKDIATQSLGEKFINFIDTSKLKLDEVVVKNDNKGLFNYVSSKNLLAGVYNATPFLVDQDTNTERPGLGVQLLIKDSQIVKMLVVLINVLGLLIPVVTLCVIIYFIPWYSFRRMRVLKKKLGLEEEKIEITEHQLMRQDKVQDISSPKPIEEIIQKAIESTQKSSVDTNVSH